VFFPKFIQRAIVLGTLTSSPSVSQQASTENLTPRIITTRVVESPGAFCIQSIGQDRFHFYLPDPPSTRCAAFHPNSIPVGEQEPAVYTLNPKPEVTPSSPLNQACVVLFKQRASLVLTNDKLPCRQQPGVTQKVVQMRRLFGGK
jgi:hypothetical protein